MIRKAWLGLGVAAAIAAAAIAFTQCGRKRSGGDEAAKAKKARHAPGTARGAGFVGPARPPAWMAQPGVADRRIAGRVTFEGAPVRSAVVRLNAGHLGDVVVVESDADGRFDLGSWPAHNYGVSASAAGKAPAVVFVDLRDPTMKPPPDALELRLGACEAALIGRVSDAAGGPVAGARIRVNALAGVTAGADGAYELCLRKGEHVIYVHADGYGGVALTIDVRGRLRRDVVLVPEATIVGRVVRLSDGTPVAGGLVRAWTRDWGRDRSAEALPVVTDDEGRFTIGGVNPGRWSLDVAAEGLRNPTPVDVTVEAGILPEEVTIKLEDAAMISGKVLSGGEPVAGVAVHVMRKNPVAYSRPAVSQADGSFTITGAPRGELTILSRSHEVVAPKEPISVKDASVGDVVVEVEAMGMIHGVVTRKGKTLEGARVYGGNQHQAVTDAQGRYELKALAPGKYTLVADSPVAGAFVERKEPVELARGEVKQVDLELEHGGAISGVVVDEAGKPVEDVVVRFVEEKTADQCTVVTAPDGAFRCDTLTGGKYQARVQSTYGDVKPLEPVKPYPKIDVADGNTEVTGVRLEVKMARLTIAGHVADMSGAPVVDALVTALITDGSREPVFSTWMRLPSAITDAEGAFEIGRLPAGDYAVQARGADGGEGTVKKVAAGTTNLTITMARPGGIEGELVGYSVTPAVYAQPVTGAFRLIAGTIDGNRFRIKSLAPGRYMVTAQTLNEGDGEVVEVKMNETTRVTLTSQGSGTLEGTVRELVSGAPLPGLVCHTVLADDGIAGVTNWDPSAVPKTDAEGRFVNPKAPAGTVQVTCFPEVGDNKLSSAAAIVDLPRGGRAVVELVAVRSDKGYSNGTIGLQIDERRAGLLVASVKPGGPAARAGLLPGDVLTAWNTHRIEGLTREGYLILLWNSEIGSTIQLTFRRGTTAEKTVSVTVEADAP